MEPDKIGLKTLQHLTNAARRGVDVTLLIDGLGSAEMKNHHFIDFRAAGGIVIEYNRYNFTRFIEDVMKLRLPFGIMAYRNHKKSIVIDDKYGYVGGMNISREWCSDRIDGGIHRFRDTHCRIQGSSIQFIKLVR